MRFGCTPVWQKRGVALTYVLLQFYREVMLLHGRVSRASQTRPARISGVFRRYLGAEMYCTYIHAHSMDKITLTRTGNGSYAHDKLYRNYM